MPVRRGMGNARSGGLRRTGLAERPSDGAAARHTGFGALLRAHRHRGLLSQEQLAGRSGVSARAIRDLERGIRRPRGESVRLLADDLGLAGWERERFEAAARSLLLAEQPPGQTVPHWPGPAVPHQLPPDIADFVGRARLMTEFHRWLAGRPDGVTGKAEGAAGAVYALSGRAGVGKTALAVHIAHQSAADFPDGQLYANLRCIGVGGVSSLDPGE